MSDNSMRKVYAATLAPGMEGGINGHPPLNLNGALMYLPAFMNASDNPLRILVYIKSRGDLVIRVRGKKKRTTQEKFIDAGKI